MEVLSYATILGITAQLLFSARFVVQYIASERAKAVLTPAIFWQLSYLAAILFFLYGFLRDDLAIMLGQTIGFFIYTRNIQLQEDQTVQQAFFASGNALFILPVMMLLFFVTYFSLQGGALVDKAVIPSFLLLLGIVGQLVFISRFVHQWIKSERKGQSHLPLGFWVISVIGALLILSYGILRKDIVLVLGHIVGIFVYSRNIYFIKTSPSGEDHN